MYATTQPTNSKQTTIILPPLKAWRLSKGHIADRGDAGVHADRRTNRLRTRQDRERAALAGE